MVDRKTVGVVIIAGAIASAEMYEAVHHPCTSPAPLRVVCADGVPLAFPHTHSEGDGFAGWTTRSAQQGTVTVSGSLVL